MKIDIVLEDKGPGVPIAVTVDWEGEADQTSLAYSVTMLFRMVMNLINSPYRRSIVDAISTAHTAMREAQEASNTGHLKCH